MLRECFDNVLEGAADGSATPVQVVADAVTSGINAQLERAASIAGTVTVGDGTPLPGVGINVGTWVESSYGGYLDAVAWSQTNADGEYLIEGLTPGTYSVCFYGDSNT